MNNVRIPVCLFAVVSLMACEGSSDITVRAYGEDFVEQGIPAEAMNDGWAVTFDRFEVSFGEVVVAGVIARPQGSIDLSMASDGVGHSIANVSVRPGRHEASGYAIDRIEIQGSAQRDGVTKTFDWTFDQATHYTSCETVTEVVDGEEGTLELTVHADHLFYDSFVASEPQLLFGALAEADADDDGVITRAELEATDIGAYDPGSQGGVNDLWSWLVAQSQTLGHIDGEGHCDAHTHTP